jgi:hypothetical protein
MITISPFAFRLGLGLALVVTGAASPGRVSTVSAQAPNACALVTVDEVGQIANASVAEGVSSALEPAGSVTCRYTWGTGVNRFKLDVIVNEASRMFPGMSADQIKDRLHGSVRVGTPDAVVSDVGEAAVFKSESPLYVGATAAVKGRIVQVYVDGFVAGEKKDQVIALLKSVVSRL